MKDLPTDRATSSDGFNGLFYKVAWPIIKDDVINTLNAFWSLDARSFHLLNDAFMVLLRKKQAPNCLKDYRPISLMHSFSKLLTKCLARRLQPKLESLVAYNQSAFIEGRIIHDNFRVVQLTCCWLHSRKSPAVLLKVDIAKAFDSVAWPFLLEVLQHVGFPRRWTNWISILLSTASTRVIVNGRPGRRIAHRACAGSSTRRSHLTNALCHCHGSAQFADQRSRLCRSVLSPLPGDVIQFRASLYADDLVVFAAPTIEDIQCILRILQLFAGASGLTTNLDKCVITPICCNEDVITAIQQIFPCVLKQFKCKYMGIPLLPTRLKHADEQPLIDCIAARIPTWKANLLTNAGRLLLTQVLLYQPFRCT